MHAPPYSELLDHHSVSLLSMLEVRASAWHAWVNRHGCVYMRARGCSFRCVCTAADYTAQHSMSLYRGSGDERCMLYALLGHCPLRVCTIYASSYLRSMSKLGSSG